MCLNAVLRAAYTTPQNKQGIPVKLAFVTDDLQGSSNGIYASAYRYAQKLRELGHDVNLVGYGASGTDAFPVPMREIPVVTPIASSCGFTFGEPHEEIFSKAFAGVDIIHLFLPFALEVEALLWAREHRIPVSAAFHLQPQNMTYNAGFGAAVGLSDAIFSYFKHRLYKHVTHIQCPSQMIKGQLEEHGYQSCLHVISNGVPEKFKPRADARFNDGKTHIVTVGRLAPEKNQAIILEGVARSRYKDAIVLHVCGQGNLKEDLRLQAQELGINCEFGFYSEDELLELEQKCSLYIHASVADIEAMGVTEALSAGAIPLIGRAPLSAPSAYALCEESLFDAQDAHELALRIDWWLDHPAEQIAWAAAYQEEAKTLSLTTCVQKFLDMEELAIENDLEAYALQNHSIPEPSTLRQFLRRRTN